MLIFDSMTLFSVSEDRLLIFIEYLSLFKKFKKLYEFFSCNLMQLCIWCKLESLYHSRQLGNKLSLSSKLLMCLTHYRKAIQYFKEEKILLINEWIPYYLWHTAKRRKQYTLHTSLKALQINNWSGKTLLCVFQYFWRAK